MILQSGLPVVASLALLFAAIVLGHRHHRREARKASVANHRNSIRMSPMREGWLIEHREREGRE